MIHIIITLYVALEKHTIFTVQDEISFWVLIFDGNWKTETFLSAHKFVFQLNVSGSVENGFKTCLSSKCFLLLYYPRKTGSWRKVQWARRNYWIMSSGYCFFFFSRCFTLQANDSNQDESFQGHRSSAHGQIQRSR